LRWQTADHSASDGRHLTTVGTSAYTGSGVIGYPHEPDGIESIKKNAPDAKVDDQTA
jgi:hypothetical protein